MKQTLYLEVLQVIFLRQTFCLSGRERLREIQWKVLDVCESLCITRALTLHGIQDECRVRNFCSVLQLRGV